MMKRIHILTARAMPGTFVVLAILVIFFISTKVCFSEGCVRSPCPPTTPPSYTPPPSPSTCTRSPCPTTPPSSGGLPTFFGNSVCDSNNLANCQTQDDCVAVGGEWYSYPTTSDIRCRERTTTVSTSTSSSPSSSGSGSWFSFLFGGGSDNSDVCGPDNLEVCDQQGCEELGDEYWWYDGSCRAGSLEVAYSGRISQAPVRLGDDANDGSITDGDGLSIIVDTPIGGRSYGILIFPGNLGYYFFDSENGLMTQMVSLTDGELFVTDDLCDILQEIPELEGNWVVAVLTVPIAVPEFYTLDDIATYLQDGGLYYFGSYTVNVHCQENQENWFFHLLQ